MKIKNKWFKGLLLGYIWSSVWTLLFITSVGSVAYIQTHYVWKIELAYIFLFLMFPATYIISFIIVEQIKGVIV